MHVRSPSLLVTVHNLCSEDLLAALRLGGLPAPSLGITSVETPFTDFGEISLIGTRDLADPGQYPVYSRDAYTVSSPKNSRGHPLPALNLEDALRRMLQPSARRRRGPYDTGRLLADTARRFADMAELQSCRKNVDPGAAHDVRLHLDALLDQYMPGVMACHCSPRPHSPPARESSALRALTAARKKGGSAEALRLELEKRHFHNVSQQVLDRGVAAMRLLQDPHTSYFEAKPDRAVLATEFAGAVVPAPSPPPLWHALQKAGLSIRAYEPCDSSHQAAATRSLAWQLACRRSDILYCLDTALLAAGVHPQGCLLPDFPNPWRASFQSPDATAHELRVSPRPSASCLFTLLDIPLPLHWAPDLWRKITAFWSG